MAYHFTPTKMAVIKMRDNSKNLWECSFPGGSDGKKKIFLECRRPRFDP